MYVLHVSVLDRGRKEISEGEFKQRGEQAVFLSQLPTLMSTACVVAILRESQEESPWAVSLPHIRQRPGLWSW